MDKVVYFKLWSNTSYMKSNEREHMKAFVCEYQGDCPMYASGRCVCEDLFLGWIKCPHSKFIQQEGVTKRAKTFGAAAQKWKEAFKTDIKTENSHLCRCGEYVFLPYPHLNVFGNKFDESLVNDHFIPAKLFDIQMVNKIVHYHPRALMGGEIEKFQKEHVPKFIRQLSEHFPELFEEYKLSYPEQAERFTAVSKDYIGRMAYLHTLKDGASFYDCHNNLWVKKDGFIICEKYQTMLHFPAGQKPRKCMHELTDDVIIKVESNDHVLPETRFAD